MFKIGKHCISFTLAHILSVFFFPSFCERKSILGFPVVRGQHLGSLPVRHTYPLGSSEPSPKAAEDTTSRMTPAEIRKDCRKKEGEHQPCRVPPEDWVLPCGSASCEDRDRISSARNFYAGRFDCCRMTFAIPSTVCVTTYRPRNLTSLHELGEMIYEGWRDSPRSTSLFFRRRLVRHRNTVGNRGVGLALVSCK